MKLVLLNVGFRLPIIKLFVLRGVMMLQKGLLAIVQVLPGMMFSSKLYTSASGCGIRASLCDIQGFPTMVSVLLGVI